MEHHPDELDEEDDGEEYDEHETDRLQLEIFVGDLHPGVLLGGHEGHVGFCAERPAEEQGVLVGLD